MDKDTSMQLEVHIWYSAKQKRDMKDKERLNNLNY